MDALLKATALPTIWSKPSPASIRQSGASLNVTAAGARGAVAADKSTFPAFAGATIAAITNNYPSAAGANPVTSSFDELWGVASEGGHRLSNGWCRRQQADCLSADHDVRRMEWREHIT